MNAPTPHATQPSTSLHLAWRLALRELRAGLAGWRVFLICLALGVATISGVGAITASVNAGLDKDARRLLGGDMDLRLQHRPATSEHIAYLRERTNAMSNMIEMRAMAQTPDKRTLVELKAVDDAWPLVGTLATDPPVARDALFAKKDGAWGAAVDQSLLDTLGLDQGAHVRVGDATFELRSVITLEPDRVATVFNFGPRLLIANDALNDTGLVVEGSQIRYHYRLLLPSGESDESFTGALEEQFPEAGWRVRGAKDAAPSVRRFVERFSMFLSLVGLSALLVGGVGVFGAVKSYMETRIATIATYKCIGAPAKLIFTIYLLQVMALASAGVIIGTAIGVGAPYVGLSVIPLDLPAAPIPGVYAMPTITAAIFGLLTALTFAIWPLARAREVPPVSLFRDLIVPANIRPRWRFIALQTIGVIALCALTIYVTPDKRFAFWFIGITLATLGALSVGARGVMALARRVRGVRGLMRLVVANLHRPGAPTTDIVLALGIGLAVLVSVALIEDNMSNQVSKRIPEKAPAFFFIDIQPQQTEQFDAIVNAQPGVMDAMRVPSLRGRIVRINGVPVDEVDINSSVAWAVRGDRALTYAARPYENTEIVEGTWWAEDYQGPPLISFDARVAKGFGVGIGDTLTLNILGREITATIASLREIDWRSLRFDFAIIFSPGILENAPHSHIAAARVPPAGEEALLKSVTDAFANVSAIRVRDALEAASAILSSISWAVRAVAAITLVAGAVVLAGTIAASNRRRVYDAVVFKVLGATRPHMLHAFVLEYALLGLISAIIAAGVGTFASWAVVRHLMHMAWAFNGWVVVNTLIFCLIAGALAGFFGTWRALGQKAAPLLRNE